MFWRLRRGGKCTSSHITADFIEQMKNSDRFKKVGNVPAFMDELPDELDRVGVRYRVAGNKIILPPGTAVDIHQKLDDKYSKGLEEWAKSITEINDE